MYVLADSYWLITFPYLQQNEILLMVLTRVIDKGKHLEIASKLDLQNQ